MSTGTKFSLVFLAFGELGVAILCWKEHVPNSAMYLMMAALGVIWAMGWIFLFFAKDRSRERQDWQGYQEASRQDYRYALDTVAGMHANSMAAVSQLSRKQEATIEALVEMGATLYQLKNGGYYAQLPTGHKSDPISEAEAAYFTELSSN